MKESRFIEQNKKNWSEFESSLRTKQNKAAKLSRLFIQITDDLSYARTFYKFRSVKIYLNGIAQVLFNSLYRNQPGNFKKFLKFWKTDLPLMIHESRTEFRIAFVVFILSFTIGVISSMYDKQFPNLILGDSYVEKTMENIRNNNPMGVYKDGNSFLMFFYIAVNNLFVALRTFAFGLFAAIGAIFALVYNGIMVGAFQYFFIERGLFLESFLTIWQHGTLEISMIIIAGAAGITLGKGLIFPGTFTRMEAFKISARRGLKIFLGISPVFLVAAFIEGFLTRHTEIIMPIRLAVIIISLLFVLVYFVWYPWYVARHEKINLFSSERVSYRAPGVFNFASILSAEEILGYTLNYFKQRALWILMLAGCFGLGHGILGIISKYFETDGYSNVIYSNITVFQSQNKFHFYIGLLTLVILFILVVLNVNKILPPNKATDKSAKRRNIATLLISATLSSFILLLPFLASMWFGVLCFIALCPFILYVLYISYDERSFYFVSISRTFYMLRGSWGRLYWNNIKMLLLLFIGYMLLSSPFVKHYISAILINFNISPDTSTTLWLFVYTTTLGFLVGLFLVLQVATSAFTVLASREIVQAESLQRRIGNFGERNIMFGFEKEF